MLDAPVIRTGRWQSIDVNSPLQATYEMLDVPLRLHIPNTIQQLQDDMTPHVNLPWAEEHFSERVAGVPLNPPPSNERWPWARHNKRFQEEGDTVKPFSHSYPERMWPRHASVNGHNDLGGLTETNYGIRYQLGDLTDLVRLLVREPLTRQAYLPIWFPEDTGTHHGQRVPCTLGYHFMIRNGLLTCRYYIRSCDLVRHFADDVYMACRLTQWVCDEINRLDDDPFPVPIIPGFLLMYISSFHAFVGDKYKMEKVVKGE